MATRGELRDAVHSHLVSSATGTYDVKDADGNVLDTTTVEADDVDLIEPEEDETLPQVVYDESYMPLNYNGVGRGPEQRTYNQDGSVNEEVWQEHMEAQFTVWVRGELEHYKEPIYEQVRTEFGKFSHGHWHASDLHSDATNVSVGDASSVDTGDAEDVIRGDQVEIYVAFHRDYPVNADNIEEVETTTEGDSYSTT